MRAGESPRVLTYQRYPDCNHPKNEDYRMKLIWPASLRASLLALVVICILPAIVLAIYTAIQRYHTSITYAYGVSKLAADAVAGRYQSLASKSHDL